jgi:flagellar biogenesis protein FliO
MSGSMDFSVRWGFPAIAKTAFGLIVFIGIILVLVVIWLIRRFSKRKTNS